MEVLFAILIVCLSTLGLSIGLLMARGAPRSSCDGLACIGGARCDACPNQARKNPQ